MEKKILTPEEISKLDLETKKKISDVEQIIRDTICDFHNYDFIKFINNYKRYLEFIAERQSSIEPWQTNVSYPLVSSVVDTMFANIFDFWYQFGITESKLKKACMDAFDFRWSWKQALKDCAKECLITWKAYSRDFIYRKKETQKILWEDIETEVKIPSMEFMSVFDVMYERSKWLSKSPFKIIRTFSTWESIINKVLPLYMDDIDDSKRSAMIKKIEKILDKSKDNYWNRFSNYDYNSVKHLTSSVQLLKSYIDSDRLKSSNTPSIPWADASTNTSPYDLPQIKSRKVWVEVADDSIKEDKNNYFLNQKESTFELVEYKTTDMSYIFINWNILWYWKRKYALGDIREIMFSSIPWTGNANGIADNLWGLQDIQNMLWNSFLDNIKLTLWPLFKVSGNLPIWKNGSLDFKSFKVFRTNGQSDIEKISLGTTDFAPINFMQAVQSTAEQRSGVNEYILGWQGRAERVAGWVDLILDQYKSKLTPITDSIDQMMADTSRNWILMYLQFFTTEELEQLWIVVERITKTQWKKEVIDTFKINGLDIKSIINEKNISFTYNSLDKLQKEAQRGTLQEVFQFILQYAWDKVNLDELIKALMWKDFDFDSIVKLEEQETLAWVQEDNDIDSLLESENIDTSQDEDINLMDQVKAIL